MINKRVIAGVLISVLSLSLADAANSAYVSQTTASISIAPRDNLIIAATIVNWDTRASDVLAVDWLAPSGSYCRSSEFMLSRGMNTTHDVSWAYRTVIHTTASGKTIACSGNWTANIVNVNTHQVLASAGYTVSILGTEAAAGS